MIVKYWFLLVCGVMLVFKPLLAGTYKTEISNALHLSGLTRQLAIIPDIIFSSVTLDMRPTRECTSDLRALIDATIQPYSIVEKIIDHLITTMTPDEINRLLVWYKSDTGKHITQTENTISSTTESRHTESGNQLLIERIASTIDATETSARLQAVIEYSVYLIKARRLEEIRPMDQIISPDDVEQLERNILPRILSSYVQIYGTLDHKELIAYLNFLSQPSSQKFYQMTVETIFEVLEKQSTQLSNRLPVACH